MIPLRFRSLLSRRARQFEFQSWAPPTLALVLLLILSGQRSLAASDSIEAQKQHLAACNKYELSIYKADGSSSIKDEFNADMRCELNAGGELKSHNAEAIVQAGIAKKRPKFFDGRFDETALKNNGICRITYQEIKDAYDRYMNLTSDFCEKSISTQTNAEKCGLITKECHSEWEAFGKVQSDYADKLTATVIQFDAHVDPLSIGLKSAQKNYEKDLRIVEKAVTDLPESSAAADEPLTIPESPDVNPSNGSKITSTYREYLDALRRPALEFVKKPTLIEEETIARNNLKDFQRKFDSLLARQRQAVTKSAEGISNDLKQADKNGSAPGTGDRINQLSTISGATQGLTQSPAAAASPLAAITAPASSAAGLAAAAGASAMASNLGSLKSGAATEAPAASMAPPAEAPSLQVASFNDHASGTGLEHGSMANNTKIEPPQGNAPEAGVYSPPTSNSESASRMPSGKKALRAEAPVAPGANGGDTKTEESLNSFHQTLDPHPVSKRPAESPGSEVANLLGQMKNLFNFDEVSPTGGAPGMSASGRAAPTATDGNAPVAGAPEQDAAAPEEARGEANETVAENPKNQEHEVQANPYGKLDTTLFKRIRARHQRCMERGLVLYGLKERVE